MLASMVTIHDLTWDDDRLLELFWALDQRDRGALMRQAAVNVCYAQALTLAKKTGEWLDETAEAVTRKELQQCMPEVPRSWVAGEGRFEEEVATAVWNHLEGREIEMVLTISDQDATNAKLLAGWALEHAQRIASDYCVSKIDDERIPIEAMQQFIEDWRDAFMARVTAPSAIGV
jgi:hypothetical protein